MPEGRMLKKVVSTSRKLANLKSDSARLLYTWLIPHLDIEGRFSADPKIVKGYVVPRLKMSTHEVAKHLENMQYNNLISIYEVNGDLFMELIKFKTFQTLNPKRESPSQIPSPQKIKRRSLNKEEYEFVWGQWEKNNMVCPVCKKKGEFIAGRGIVIDGYVPFQVDHKIPISKVDESTKENLWVICQKCNAKKANKILTLDLLQTNSGTSKVKGSKVKGSKVVKEENDALRKKIIDYFNKTTGQKRSYTSDEANKFIEGRINEGRDFKDFKHVIDTKTAQWLNDSKMRKFLRPSTLFRPGKFEDYVNEPYEDPKKLPEDPKEKEKREFNAMQKKALEGK